MWTQSAQTISPLTFAPAADEVSSTATSYVSNPSNVPLDPNVDDLNKIIADTHRLYVNIIKSAELTSEKLKQQGVNWKNPALYKTSVCDSWKNFQSCKYGPKCWYAHGTEELRYVPRLDQIPMLLESLSSTPVNLQKPKSSENEIPFEFYQKTPTYSANELPFEYYQKNPPPKTYNNHPTIPAPQYQQDYPNSGYYTTDSVYSGATSDYGYQYRAPPPSFFPCMFVGAQEVQEIPGIVTGTIDTDSIVSGSWYSDRPRLPSSDFNNSAAANFKQKVQEALLEDESTSEDHPDIKNEWEELANFIDKKRGRDYSDSSNSNANEVLAPSRAMFMKSFHPFGQSYPLSNWL